jgi:hypothetical protein
MGPTVLFILLIILIIVAVILFMSIAKDNSVITIPDLITSANLKTGGGPEEVKKPSFNKVIVVDGLNYIYSKLITPHKNPVNIDDENIFNQFPNVFYIWKALSTLRTEHKKEHIVFVIKNRDNYQMSVYDDKLYKRWAKVYKVGIILCYDSSELKGPHYIKGRDDKTVCELYDKYKKLGVETELLSKDNYNDRADFGNIPQFKKIRYGEIPYISD